MLVETDSLWCNNASASLLNKKKRGGKLATRKIQGVSRSLAKHSMALNMELIGGKGGKSHCEERWSQRPYTARFHVQLRGTFNSPFSRSRSLFLPLNDDPFSPLNVSSVFLTGTLLFGQCQARCFLKAKTTAKNRLHPGFSFRTDLGSHSRENLFFKC